MLSELDVKEPGIYKRFEFCEIKPELSDEVVKIEQICFPPNEACTPEHMKARIKVAPDLFLVIKDRENDGKIVGFLNGIATNERIFRDKFFTDESLHEPDGETVMIMGLDVLPEYRKMGLARELVFNYCRKEQARGRKRLILTCHKEKIKMYRKFGFDDLGESASEWGGEKWHEMEIRLNF
jgi:ribosomal protein S18 acetylase RimI-like enzyme